MIKASVCEIGRHLLEIIQIARLECFLFKFLEVYCCGFISDQQNFKYSFHTEKAPAEENKLLYIPGYHRSVNVHYSSTDGGDVRQL